VIREALDETLADGARGPEKADRDLLRRFSSEHNRLALDSIPKNGPWFIYR
jgi:hypothetical protein